MATNNQQLVRDFIQACDSKKIDQMVSILAPEAVFKLMSMPNEPMKGSKEIREGFEGWYKTFPDLKSQVVNLISAGDFVVVESVMRGTHDGPMMSPKGELPATHRKIEVPACDVYKIENGKIALWDCYWQGDLMMKQLGFHMPSQAAA